MNLTSIADIRIVRAKNTDVLLNKNYDTADIMHAVFNVYNKYWQDVKQFAPALKGRSLYETCSNIWHFVKQHIRYVKDPADNQWVRSPKRLWADREGDCKSYSVFIAALLKCLKIPHIFRFVSFDKFNSNATHVYIVVMDGREEIVLDCVVNAFNKEAPYTFKFDYMKGLYEMNGIPGVHGGAGTALFGAARKDALTKALPQLAINFAYSFIPHGGFWNNDKRDWLSPLPSAVRSKESMMWSVLNDWSDWAGWNEVELMATVRQHLTNILGEDPETWWVKVLRGQYGLAGIGSVATALTVATGNPIFGATAGVVGSFLSSIFGGAQIQWKVPLTSFTPSESDWPGVQQSLNPVALLKTKATLGVNPVSNTTLPIIPVSTSAYPVYNNPYSYADPYQSTPVFDTATGLFKDYQGNYYNAENVQVDPATGRPVTATSLGTSNMLLTVGLLAGAAFFLFKKKK